MKFKTRKVIYLSIYVGYLLFLLVNAIFFGQYEIFDVLYYYLFPGLLVTIFISFASFLSTILSFEKYKGNQFKYILILHGGYFLVAMLIFRIIFYQ